MDLAAPDPVELQRGPGLAPPLLRPAAQQPSSLDDLDPALPLVLPRVPAGRPLQLIQYENTDLGGEEGAEWSVELYFAERPPRPDEDVARYLDSGALIFRQTATIGRGAEAVLAALAEQGRSPLPPVVLVGPYEAVAVHSDPILRNDLRPWHLYWSDGTSDFSFIGDVDIADLAAMARSLYCSG